MIRLRIIKIVRERRELDSFTDAQCLEFCAAVARREQIRSVGPAVTALTFVPLTLMVTLLLGPILAERTDPGYSAIAAPVLSLVFAAQLGLAVRARAWRQVLDEHIASPSCPMCEFSLRGLRVEGEAVRCPECGSRTGLAEHLLTREMLQPLGPCQTGETLGEYN